MTTVQLEGLPSDSARPAVHIERHRALTSIARKHMGFVAWPTVVLVSVALVAILLSSYAAIAGYWPYWAAMLANGYLFTSMFVGLHEAIHKTLSGNDPKMNWLNDVVGWVCGIVVIIPYFGFDTTHILHHRYTNDPKYDPDHWCKGRNPVALLFRFFTLKFHYLWKIYNLNLHKSEAGVRRAWVGNLHDLLPLAIMISGFWGGWAYPVFMLWIAPSFLNLAFIGGVLNWIPHAPHTSQERYRDASVILLARPLQRIMDALTLGQTYHLIHHLFPRIPFYRYARAFDEMRPLLEAEKASIHNFQR